MDIGDKQLGDFEEAENELSLKRQSLQFSPIENGTRSVMVT